MHTRFDGTKELDANGSTVLEAPWADSYVLAWSKLLLLSEKISWYFNLIKAIFKIVEMNPILQEGVQAVEP